MHDVFSSCFHIAQPLTEVDNEVEFSFRFADVDKLPPPVLSFDNVAFAYNGKIQDALYRNLELAIDTDSRIALVGPNGMDWRNLEVCHHFMRLSSHIRIQVPASRHLSV